MEEREDGMGRAGDESPGTQADAGLIPDWVKVEEESARCAKKEPLVLHIPPEGGEWQTEDEEDERGGVKDPTSYDIETAWGMRGYWGCLSKDAKRSQAQNLMLMCLEGWEKTTSAVWHMKQARNAWGVIGFMFGFWGCWLLIQIVGMF